MTRMHQTLERCGLLFAFVISVVWCGNVEAQKSGKKHPRVMPPTFQPNEFSGVFFADPLAQLQGDAPNMSAVAANTETPDKGSSMGDNAAPGSATGNRRWKELISPSSIEDLVKESKSRLDGVITTPAKFAGGGYADTRREFTLLASLMAVVAQYPEEIRWQSSAGHAKNVFARLAANCKVGTNEVFREAKERQTDLQDMLKGTKLSGTSDEKEWPDIADLGPTMKILEWALRENLAPSTNNESKFKQSSDEVLKYAELVAMMGHIIQQEGMTFADDQSYTQMASVLTTAAIDLAQAAKKNDAEMARAAVSRIDQSCNKCHESFR